MNNFCPISRDYLQEFRLKLPKSVFSNAYLMMLHLLVGAQHHDGFVYGVPLKRGQLLRGRFALAEETGLSEQQVRTSLSHLKAINEVLFSSSRNVTSKVTKGTSIITCLNYDVWCSVEKPSNQKSNQQVTSKQPASNHIQEEEEESKPRNHVSLSTQDRSSNLPFSTSVDNGSGAVASLPPALDAPPKPSRKRKAKDRPPADPLTDPNVFLHRVEAEHPDTVLVWGRDVGAVKTLLSGRLRAGVVDPQAEAWEAWGRFVGGTVDDSLTDFKTGELRQAHDVLTFVGRYALLQERAGVNGNGHGAGVAHRAPRESAYDKCLRWAEEEERKEREEEGR